ncbi:hypothetical protein [Pedobacter sp. Leaf132]|nr:hypothetical protein [Pedobacter sp. Leaf132]
MSVEAVEVNVCNTIATDCSLLLLLIKNMNNQFENIDVELKDLRPTVRVKALEILEAMPEEMKTDRMSALKNAIEQAENWFMDSEG